MPPPAPFPRRITGRSTAAHPPLGWLGLLVLLFLAAGCRDPEARKPDGSEGAATPPSASPEVDGPQDTDPERIALKEKLGYVPLGPTDEGGWPPVVEWAELGVPVRDEVLTLDNPKFGLVHRPWDLGFLSAKGVEATLSHALSEEAELPADLALQLGLYKINKTGGLSGSIDILWRCEPEAMPAVLDHFERAWKENYPGGGRVGGGATDA